jgi:hypothetical protein
MGKGTWSPLGRPKGYPKSGGRTKGVRNRIKTEAILRRELEREQEREAARLRSQGFPDEVIRGNVAGRKLGKEVLDDLVAMAVSQAARFQPFFANGKPNPFHDAVAFERWMDRAADYAAKVAPYQSPRLAAVVMEPVETPISEMTADELRASIMEDVVELGLVPRHLLLAPPGAPVPSDAPQGVANRPKRPQRR